ncbi:hypothetical protein RRG08_047897 [Elysia crispata]|uniref:Uncharacterized protein n=1 Tax=Elysia crispata TaxID=231223 RepID=A0AAE0ZMQ0_9GAST|nr:hypothetical protein RRG08_047897 [Elysia crispata]
MSPLNPCPFVHSIRVCEVRRVIFEQRSLHNIPCIVSSDTAHWCRPHARNSIESCSDDVCNDILKHLIKDPTRIFLRLPSEILTGSNANILLGISSCPSIYPTWFVLAFDERQFICSAGLSSPRSVNTTITASAELSRPSHRWGDNPIPGPASTNSHVTIDDSKGRYLS